MQQQNKSTHIPYENTLVQQALSYFHISIPLPISKLQLQLTHLPVFLQNQTLQKQIYWSNKMLILQQFKQICTVISSIYTSERQKQNPMESMIIAMKKAELKSKQLANYSQEIQKQLKEVNKLGDIEDHTYLESALTVVGEKYYRYYQLATNRQSTMTMSNYTGIASIRLPQKFQSIIQENVNKFYPSPIADDKVLINKADLTSSILHNTYFSNPSHNSTDSEQNTGIKKTKSEDQLQEENQFQQIVDNLVQKVEENYMKKSPTSLPVADSSKNIDFIDEKGELTFYQAHMIAHLGTLLLYNYDKFLITSVSYFPYLEKLKREIDLQIKHLKNGFKENSEGKQSMSKQNRLKRAIYNVKLFMQSNKSQVIVKEEIEVLKMIQEINLPIIENLQFYSAYLSALPTAGAVSNFVGNLESKLGSCSHHHDSFSYHQIQSQMIFVILIYRAFSRPKVDHSEPESAISQKYYTAYRRKNILQICKRVFTSKSSKFNFKNWALVLKYIENSRREVQASNQCVTEKADEMLAELFKKLTENKNNTWKQSIFDGGLKNFAEQLPKMKLVCLSDFGKKGLPSPKCKVVHLFISGFLSEDTDKYAEWADLVDIMPDSEIYAVIWQSSTKTNLVKFILKSTKDLVTALTSLKMKEELQKKYKDNPFNPAFEVARITGRILAQLVVKLFPNRFINIVGYSLGTEVIKQFLSRIVHNNNAEILNNIYLMGGVTDTNELASIISQSSVPISLYNCYTMHDKVLLHLLSLCRPNIQPIGLNQVSKIQGHCVKNVNCTKFVSGHLAFRSNMDILGKILEFSNG